MELNLEKLRSLTLYEESTTMLPEIQTTTKGSAFVRVLKLDESRDPKKWTHILLVHNKRKPIPKKKHEWKTPGWSMPGGGIQDYANYTDAKYDIPDGCECETPIEAALRELFEEAHKILDIRYDRTDDSPNNESQKLVDLLTNLSSERAGKRAVGSAAYQYATQELINTVHAYAERVLEMGVIEYKFADTSKPERPPSFIFEVWSDDLYLGEKLDPNFHDDGKNTDKAEWFTRETVDEFTASFFANASAYYDHLHQIKSHEIFRIMSANRVKQVALMTAEEVAALPPLVEVPHPGKPPLYIYRSTLERLDLKPQ